jgi:sugar lactone lactonase YvrE
VRGGGAATPVGLYSARARRTLAAVFRSFVLVLTFGLLEVAAAADPRYTFTRWTGTEGGAGAEDGDGASARFFSPVGITADSAGNLYVADLNNGTVRKVAPDGTTTTLAGLAGVIGNANGIGAAAQFNGPGGTAVDSAGNVYVADLANHSIRKITPAGVVSLFAGSGFRGAGDGRGSKASFYYPADVAVDGAGNVYVADGGNDTIRKITPAGDVTTLAGSAGTEGLKDGAGKVALFRTPQGVAVDGNGNVYVADARNDAIRKIAPDGQVTTIAGNGTPGRVDGSGATATFYRPCGVTVGDGGTLYIADTDNNLIRKITPDRVVTTIAGGVEFSNSGSADGTGRDARFAAPYDIAADGAGNLYVAEGNNNIIRKVTTSGVATTLAGRARALGPRDGALSEALFTDIRDMAADSLGNVFLIDGKLIRKISAAGVVSTIAGGPFDPLNTYVDGAASVARFQNPRGLAADGSGNLYVTEPEVHTIRKVAPNGTVTTFAGKRNQKGRTDGTLSQAQFASPKDVAVDRDGTIYVAEDCTIRKIANGTVSTVVGNAGSVTFGCFDNVDGPFATAKLNAPDHLVIDAAGNLYVTTTEYYGSSSIRSTVNTIRKITPTGFVTAVAGDGRKGQAYRDASGTLASFFNLGGIAVDASGNIFATEFLVNTVRKVSGADRAVTTIGGVPGEIGTTDATGADARFDAPYAIVIDSTGRLLIADMARIRVAKPALADKATVDAIVGVVGGQRQFGTAPRGATTWSWSPVRQPSASTAQLSSRSIAEPTFIPDLTDLFQFRLTASDFASTSITDVFLLGAEGTATPTGNNVRLSGTNVSLTFTNVKSAGQTVIAILDPSFSETLPDPTKHAQAVYEMTTTADTSPPARFCVALPTISNVSDLPRTSLYHREGAALVDRTTTRDAATKTICADLQTLGRVVLGGPTPRRRAVVP